MKRCGVLQKVSRPKSRCHETSHPEPNQLRSVPVNPTMSGIAVPVRAMTTRRSGRAIHAMNIGASLRRGDADDLVSRPVAGGQVERPVGALSSGAEAAVRPVKEDV